MNNIGTVEEITGKKTYKVTIPLTYEVIIDINDELDSALVEEMGIEAAVRVKARRIFLEDTAYSRDSHKICNNVRSRVDDFWNQDTVTVKRPRHVNC